MPTNDQRTEHFRDAIALILKRRVEFPRGCLVTVKSVKMTNDLKFANVVLSVLPVSAELDVLQALDDYRKEISKDMAFNLKMRQIPKLHWSFDHTEENAQGIENFIEELKRKGEL
jgi:ribosome-binding factor A